MRLSPRSLAALAVMGIGVLAAAPVAQAVTAEVRVVSALAHYDTEGVLVDPDTGWWGDGTPTGTLEIGSAYGGPTGLGRQAVMLDTPTAGDSVQLTALTEQPPLSGAFPGHIAASPDLHLGFWLYLSSASTSNSSPLVEGWIGMQGSGSAFGYVIATFDPMANGYTQRDTWMYVDTTAPTAVWSVRRAWSEEAAQATTWEGLIDHTHGTHLGQDAWGGFEYGLSFRQDAPSTFSAIDGITVTTAAWSSVTDFELRATSGPPLLDDCKNNGWKDSYPADAFKNQGACIAAIVARG